MRQTNFRAVAERRINHAGQPSTYSKLLPGTYDENTGVYSTGFATPISLNAYFSKLSESEARNPTLVGVDASEVWIAYNDLPQVPVIGSLIQSFGETYTVLSFKSHNYSAGVACWVLVCKRG